MELPRTVKVNNSTIVVAVGLSILFITSWAQFTNNLLSSDITITVLNYSLWPLVAVGLLFSNRVKRFSSLEITAMIAVLIYRAYNIFHAFDYQGIGLTSILVGLFCCYMSDDEKAKVFKYFKYLMVAVSIYGIICYISYFAHFGISYAVVQRGGGVNYIDYKLCYLMEQYGTMIRFNGFFEEPGWFGTWAAFYLCADGINLRKKANIILLIAGTLSFSLAFFLLLIMYYVLKNLSDWKKWIWVVVIAVFYFFVIPNIHTGNYIIDNALERMVIIDGRLVGDNRYGSLFEQVWQQTINGGKLIFGYGAGYAEYYGTGEGQGLASIKSYIVNFGIVGIIIIFGPILFVSVRQALKNRNREMLFYIIITYVSLYQRPYLFWTPYLFMFLCGISYTKVYKSGHVLVKNIRNNGSVSTVMPVKSRSNI